VIHAQQETKYAKLSEIGSQRKKKKEEKKGKKKTEMIYHAQVVCRGGI
jgi:hypothetical protein